MTSFYRAKRISNRRAAGAHLDSFNLPFVFTHGIISITGDGGEAFLSILSILWTQIFVSFVPFVVPIKGLGTA
jgi:hypothetical protein